jgi:WD40 repeat protein
MDDVKGMRRTTLPAICVCLAGSLFGWSTQIGRAQPAKVTAKVLYTISEEGYDYLWSPDSKTLAMHVVPFDSRKGAQTTDVWLYDAATGKVRATIKDEGQITRNGLYFTRDGSALIIHSDRVRLYSVTDGKSLREFAPGTTPINFYDKIFEPEISSRLNESTGLYEDVLVYPSKENVLKELPTEYISDRRISPDGTSLMVRADDGKVQVYDLSDGSLKFTLDPLVNKITGASQALGEYSPDGRFIVTTHRNNSPCLWNASSGDLIAILGPQADAVYGARFSYDSKYVVTTSFDGIVKLWDTATGKSQHTIGSKKDPLYFATWNPANDTFVTKSRKWEVAIWSAETGQLISRPDNAAIKEKFDVNMTFVYSPDGKILVTKAKNEAGAGPLLTFGMGPLKMKQRLIAHLWNAETGALITSLRDNQERDAWLYARDKFFWSSSSDFLVTAGITVKLWNRRGQLLQELDDNQVWRVGLSPNEKLLAISGDRPMSMRSVMLDTAKIFIGKLPNGLPLKTYIWQLEGT